MMTLAIVLGALAAFALIRVGVQVRYDAKGLFLRICAGALGVQVYPKKVKKIGSRRLAGRQMRKAKRQFRREARKKSGKSKRSKKKVPDTSQMKKSGLGSIGAIGPLLELGKDLLGDMRRKLLVRKLWLRVIFGGDDAARSAILYGQAWAIISAVMPGLESIFTIRDRDVAAEFDPTKTQMELNIQLDLRVRIGAMVALGFKAGFRFLKIILKQKKAVLKHESSSG